MNVQPPRILLVEDDQALAHLVVRYLEANGLEVTHIEQAEQALPQLLQQRPDVVLLDWDLPGLSGLALCQKIKPEFTGSVLMLTGKTTPQDELQGLEAGADDYLKKPLDPRVLLARIQLCLSRQSQAPVASTLYHEMGALTLDAKRREVCFEGAILPLSDAEFDVLWVLCSAHGQTLSREALLKQLRGVSYDGLDRSVDNRIVRLRKKLAHACGSKVQIKTVRGQGYCCWVNS